MSDEQNKRSIKVGEKYPIWYKDTKFLFSWEYKYNHPKYHAVVSLFKIETKQGWFGKLSEIHRCISTRYIKDDKKPEERFWGGNSTTTLNFFTLWGDYLEPMLKQAIIDSDEDRPFIIECSESFPR